MKTAILLSGQIRDAKDCFQTLEKHVISPYSADIFIDTWVPDSAVLDHRGNLIENNLTSDDILQLYKPKLACFEDFNTSPFFQKIKQLKIENKTAYDGSFAWETKTENIFYMYYKVWRSFLLMQHYEKLNNFQYDIVIRMRFDLFFESFPLITPVSNTVYIPSGFDHRGGINDLLCLGDQITMEKVCNLFTHLTDYANPNTGIGFHPESILRKHIDLCNLHVDRFQIAYKLRGNYV